MAELVFCVRLLDKTLSRDGYSTLALDAALRDSTLSPTEKRRVSALYYGVLERLITLDAVIAAYSKQPLRKLDGTVLNLLRCGVYRLCYQSIPANAAVNEAVAAAKTLRFASASGFVNAVLRGFLRDDKKIPLPKDPIAAKSVTYSAPPWLVAQLRREYGEEAAISLLSDSLGRAPVTIRRNALRCTAEELLAALSPLKAEPVALLPDCFSVAGGDVTNTAAFQKGFFHVQDLASQLCCAALGVSAGDTVLDVCAAPGGKSFTLAELLGGTGRVLAFDLHEARVGLIRDGAARLGLTNLTAAVGDATVFSEANPTADRILCDVPCSGLGVIRRKPEIKYKPRESLDSLPPLQLQILETASRYLKPDGVLVYSTCTVSRAENDKVVEAFLAWHPDFETEPILPALGAPFGAGTVTLFPKDFGSDGFFMARLHRCGTREERG